MALERLAEDAHGDLVYPCTKPWSDGTAGITLSPLALLEKLAAFVPLPRVHLVCYAGCLAPQSKLRDTIIPTPRQQGVDEEEAQTGTPSWNWAMLLGRVFALDMATCPLCHHCLLSIITSITQESVITRLLRHCKPASVPPPLAPARARQATFDWVAQAYDVMRGLGGDERAKVTLFPSTQTFRKLLRCGQQIPEDKNSKSLRIKTANP